MSVFQHVVTAALLFWLVFAVRKKGGKPQLELISCFCCGTFWMVDDSVNIYLKFPFYVFAENCQHLLHGKVQKFFVFYPIYVFF